MTIFYTEKFRDEYRKTPSYIQEKAKGLEALFSNDPAIFMDTSRDLRGALEGFQSLPVDDGYKIVFEIRNAGQNPPRIILHSIGNHAMYK